MPTIIIIIFDLLLVFVIVSLRVAGDRRNKRKQVSSQRPKTHVNGRRASDYSFKFSTPANDNSHQEQIDYQHEYSLKQISDPQRYQELRERRELSRIVDPPLSEAERNVLGYHIKDKQI